MCKSTIEYVESHMNFINLKVNLLKRCARK